MESKLQIKTKAIQEKDDNNNGVLEPVSPSGQYLSSKALDSYILAILEFEVCVNDSYAQPQLRDVFLPLNPRFSSIMIMDQKGVKQWKRIEVNLEDHINVPSYPEGLPIESYDEYFDKYMTKIATDKLPQNRPLWELHVFKYTTSKASSHVIFKFHHALGDGYSLMGALLSCVKRADNPSLPLSFPSAKIIMADNKRKLWHGCINMVPRAIRAIYEGACDFGWGFLKSNCIVDHKSPIRNEKEGHCLRQLTVSIISLSLDQIKHIKTMLGTTVNDTITGIVFLGIRLYMQSSHTKFRKSRSTATMMFNTRNISSYMSVEEMINAQTKIWGNQFTFLHVALPKLINTKCSDPVDFVYKARKQITRLRRSPIVYLNAQCIEHARKRQGSEAVGQRIHDTLYKSSLSITNLIGPVEQVTLSSYPIKGMYFMVTGCPQSLMITMMSYMKTLRIALGVEKGFIDSQKLKLCIENAFELIYEAATKTTKQNKNNS